jgi:CyaY protein
MLSDSQFEALATRALERVEASLEASGIDADFELKEGGVLEIEFADASKIIVNRHAAAREIWVAARAGGFHFRWDGAAWRDTREGSELFAALSKLVSAQGGEAVLLRPRLGARNGRRFGLRQGRHGRGGAALPAAGSLRGRKTRAAAGCPRQRRIGPVGTMTTPSGRRARSRGVVQCFSM